MSTIRKYSMIVPVSWEQLAKTERRYHRVLIAPVWVQRIRYVAGTLTFRAAEFLRRRSERSPWVLEAGGYEYEEAILQIFTPRSRVIFDETHEEYMARVKAEVA